LLLRASVVMSGLGVLGRWSASTIAAASPADDGPPPDGPAGVSREEVSRAAGVLSARI